MTKVLFKLIDSSSIEDKKHTLKKIHDQFEDTPEQMFPGIPDLENIYNVNIQNADEQTINNISSMPHIEFCELPPVRYLNDIGN